MLAYLAERAALALVDARERDRRTGMERSVLQRELNLSEGANLVDKFDNALEKIGLADELRGQPLRRKIDAALQTLGVTPQTSVPMGAPVSNAPVTAPVPMVGHGGSRGTRGGG